jgi:tetratricopeptide (TPR) repeat protein
MARAATSLVGLFGLFGIVALVACERERPAPPPPAAPGAMAASGAPAQAGGGTTALDEPLEKPKAGDPQKAQPLFRQALALAGAQRAHDAVLAFEQALAAEPANLGGRVAYGWILLDEGDEFNAGEALRQFRLARLIDALDTLAVCGEGIARAAVGDDTRAEPLLTASLASATLQRDAPRLAAAQAALARIRATQGRNDEAIELLAKAADAKQSLPQNRAAWLVRRADLLAELGRREEAERLVRDALALDPEHVHGRYLLAQLLTRRGALDEAKHEARIHDLLRQLYDHRTKRLEADVELRLKLRRALVEADPANARARYQLVRELLDCRKWSDADGEVAALLKRDGSTAELHWLRARAKAGAGDVTGAKSEADAMRRDDPSVPSEVLRSILEDWRKGNPDVTAADLQKKLAEWTAH